MHVLSLPPAFVLSQDQTLRFDLKSYTRRRWFSKQSNEVPSKLKTPNASASDTRARRLHVCFKRETRTPWLSSQRVQTYPQNSPQGAPKIKPRTRPTKRRPRLSFFLTLFNCQRTRRKSGAGDNKPPPLDKRGAGDPFNPKKQTTSGAKPNRPPPSGVQPVRDCLRAAHPILRNRPKATRPIRLASLFRGRRGATAVVDERHIGPSSAPRQHPSS